MELVTLAGVVLALFAVFGGALLEGLHLGAILQGTAAIIVFGGTLAAVLISFPKADLLRALSQLRTIFYPLHVDIRETIDEIIAVAAVARKDGLLSLDARRDQLKDPLFKKSLKYVIDGFDPQTVKDILQAEIDFLHEEEEMAAKVWETAGGYAPTVGIIGAVLGLIHVMANMNQPGNDLGAGIAVAFVATVYGVGAANLFFLPFGMKLKRHAELRAASKEVVRLGVLGIQEGINPNFLKERLEVYIKSHAPAADAQPQSTA